MDLSLLRNIFGIEPQSGIPIQHKIRISPRADLRQFQPQSLLSFLTGAQCRIELASIYHVMFFGHAWLHLSHPFYSWTPDPFHTEILSLKALHSNSQLHR